MENKAHPTRFKRIQEPNVDHDLSGLRKRVKTEKNEDEEFDENKVKVEWLQEDCDPSISSSTFQDVKKEIKDIAECNESAGVCLQDVKSPGEDSFGVEVLPGVNSIKKECEVKVEVFYESSDNNGFKYDTDCKDFIADIVPKELDCDSDQCRSSEVGNFSDSKANGTNDELKDTSKAMDQALNISASEDHLVHALSNDTEEVQNESKDNRSSNLLASVHLNKKKFQCDLCESRFGRKFDLTCHIEFVHLNITKFQCDLCQSRFRRKADLRCHIEGHLDIKQFECHLCDYRSSVKTHLRVHIDNVHLNIKKFQCHLCDVRCSQKSKLKLHISRVHADKYKFQCHMCKCHFEHDSNLIRHINRAHLKYKCRLCDYRSSEKIDLTLHTDSIHVEIKNFECHLCEYRCSLKPNLTLHMGNVHLKNRR